MSEQNPEVVAVKPWVLPLLLVVVIQVVSGLVTLGVFRGSFDEFKSAVNQRLDRIERRQDEERTRGTKEAPPFSSRRDGL